MKQAFAIIGTSLALWANPAQASNPCGPRDIVAERLASKYGEHARALGLDTNNGVVEVYANFESGSWTITVTSVTGLTCLIASGLSFEGLNTAPDVPDEDV